jgi:diaminopimelate epimerase
MKTLTFWKYHGLGNDFVMFNGMQDAESILRKLTQETITSLCDRHTGIGADGVIVAGTTDTGYRMTYFNADGFEAEMCGNGLRCTVALLTSLGEDLTHETEIATGGGPISAIALPDGTVRNTMPAPKFRNISGIPDINDPKLRHAVTIDDHRFDGVIVDTGNPHYVIDRKVSLDELLQWGPKLEEHQLFPNRTNVEFIGTPNRNSVEILIWERGVGRTLASGSGATASVVAAAALGLVDLGIDITAHMEGGALSVQVSSDFREIWLQGPAQFVFQGELTQKGDWHGLVS